MEHPLKAYGLNLLEIILSDFLAIAGWLLVIFAIVAVVFSGTFFEDPFVSGLLTAGTFLTGLVMQLGSAGIRQNRPAANLGMRLFAVVTLGWLANGLFAPRVGALIAGIIMLLDFGLLIFLRQQSVKARFKPRFFSLRQFETMVQVADTMIDGDGQEKLHPIEVAINTDHLLAEIDSPMKGTFKTVLIVVEWLLPLIIGRPFPFSDLGSNERRRAVEKVIGAGGIFRDVARGLKAMASLGYYGSPKVMAHVGYVPFEERGRFQGAVTTPQHYPDPFTEEASTSPEADNDA